MLDYDYRGIATTVNHFLHTLSVEDGDTFEDIAATIKKVRPRIACKQRIAGASFWGK